LVHPECRPEVLEKADFVGSTSQILRFVRESSYKEFIIGTEMGILHKLKKENPNKRFYLLSPGLICPNMKKTRLQDVCDALLEEKHQIQINDEIGKKALNALNKMLEYC